MGYAGAECKMISWPREICFFERRKRRCGAEAMVQLLEVHMAILETC